MFQLSNTCEIDYLEMLAQSFSTNVSTNLSKISKCCWELQTEQVVPALAGKEKANEDTESGHTVRKSLYETQKCTDRHMEDVLKMYEMEISWAVFCFVSSYLLWPKLCVHHREDPSFKTWGRWSVKGILRFLAFPPTPKCLTQQWASSDSRLGIPRMVNAAATVYLWFSTFIWIELTG